MLKSFTEVVKIFCSIDRKSLILYLTYNFAQAPILIGELLYTRYFMDTIVNSAVGLSMNIVFNNMMILLAIIYINTLLSGLNALSLTNIIEAGLFRKEEIIIQKTLKLSMIELDSPNTKSHRERAMTLTLDGLLNEWVYFITDALKVTFLTSVLIYYKLYILVPIIVSFIILQLFTNKYAATKVEKINQKQVSSNRLLKYLFSLLTDRENIPEISVLGIHKYLKNKLSIIFNKNLTNTQRGIFDAELVKFFLTIFFTAINIAVTIALILTTATDIKSGGQFVLLFQLVNNLFSLGSSLSSHYHNLTQYIIRYNDFSSYLQKAEEEICYSYSDVNGIGLEIKMKNLEFTYPDSKAKALNGINLDIKAGEKIAFVGENGSGKSTLIKIILGLYKPDKGTICWYIDGDIVPHNSIGNKARVVFQDFAKLLRPIRENVALGDVRKIDSAQELCAALEKADINDYAENLDSLIGPEFGGMDLSGGQWQRLATARAYLNSGSLLVYDEATSAMDPEAELKAFKSFLDLADNKTAIFVTHRLSMTKFVDKIAVIEEGKIIEYGTHQELLRKNHKYTQMYKAQSSMYINYK